MNRKQALWVLLCAVVLYLGIALCFAWSTYPTSSKYATFLGHYLWCLWLPLPPILVTGGGVCIVLGFIYVYFYLEDD